MGLRGRDRQVPLITGRLTPVMLDDILGKAKGLARIK